MTDMRNPADRAAIPDQETLKALLDYDPQTGALRWRARPREMFTTALSMNTWNSRYAGKLALNTIGAQGYKFGSLFGRRHTAHRVIWKLVYGETPDHVDHIDRCKTNNALANLRNVTASENARNISLPSDNKTGHVGVCYNSRRGKWLAQIGRRGKASFLGYFDDINAAIAARKAAEAELGYRAMIAASTPHDDGGE